MSSQPWHITYRGSLSSCNYDCHYCPFAKTTNSRTELQQDYQALDRFVTWVQQRPETIRLLITPWGEALVRKPYQQAMITLSHANNIDKVAIQTNLSGNLAWVNQANKQRLALWTTFHPSQTTLEKFVAKCLYLHQNKVRFSVGTVGLKSDLDLIEALRKALPESIYLWVNAYKDEANYYADQDIRRIMQVDPLFDINRQNYPSMGEDCDSGHHSFMVDHLGDVQRCHLIKDKFANIYDDDFARHLQPRVCGIERCDCHIGYIHLKKLKLHQVFKHGMVERIPNLKIYNS